jgi:anthranilate synthase/aminodeoxychorismate synthase-like glutamine amidotransferase
LPRVILVVDNYDSFVWNLVHALAAADAAIELGRDIVVVRNDRISPKTAAALDQGRGPSHIVLSPGPCSPAEAGASGALVEAFAGRVPILGVCLGHQCIAAAAGMEVVESGHPVHGKSAPVQHDGRGLFRGLPSPLEAARYHSLVVPRIASGWECSAWLDDEGGRTVMGLRRRWERPGLAPIEGVQFHPESFMTGEGVAMLRNFLGQARGPTGEDEPRA